ASEPRLEVPLRAVGRRLSPPPQPARAPAPDVLPRQFPLREEPFSTADQQSIRGRFRGDARAHARARRRRAGRMPDHRALLAARLHLALAKPEATLDEEARDPGEGPRPAAFLLSRRGGARGGAPRLTPSA